MSDSPAAPSPYEVLGVRPDVSHDELRRAYRRLLRETHPDTGGTAAAFQAVQQAWELVGDPEDRARYDRGEGVAVDVGHGEDDELDAPVGDGHDLPSCSVDFSVGRYAVRFRP